jgi:hypothetical protein
VAQSGPGKITNIEIPGTLSTFSVSLTATYDPGEQMGGVYTIPSAVASIGGKSIISYFAMNNTLASDKFDFDIYIFDSAVTHNSTDASAFDMTSTSKSALKKVLYVRENHYALTQGGSGQFACFEEDELGQRLYAGASDTSFYATSVYRGAATLSAGTVSTMNIDVGFDYI